MSETLNRDLTTLVCLFHHQDHAQAAVQDLLKASIPESSITMTGGPGSTLPVSLDTLEGLGVPQADLQHLLDGLKNGGALVSVSAIADHVDTVEDIFEKHNAEQIDDVEDEEFDPDYDLENGTETLGSSTLPTTSSTPVEPLAYGNPLTTGGTRVYRVVALPDTDDLVMEKNTDSADVDPRELGLDGRLKPVDPR